MDTPDARPTTPPPGQDTRSIPHEVTPGARHPDGARSAAAGLAPGATVDTTAADPHDTPDVLLDEPGYGHGV